MDLGVVRQRLVVLAGGIQHARDAHRQPPVLGCLGELLLQLLEPGDPPLRAPPVAALASEPELLERQGSERVRGVRTPAHALGDTEAEPRNGVLVGNRSSSYQKFAYTK